MVQIWQIVSYLLNIFLTNIHRYTENVAMYVAYYGLTSDYSQTFPHQYEKSIYVFVSFKSLSQSTVYEKLQMGQSLNLSLHNE